MEQEIAAQSGLRPGPIDDDEALVIDLRPSKETSPDAPPYTFAIPLSAVPIRASKLRAGLAASQDDSLEPALPQSVQDAPDEPDELTAFIDQINAEAASKQNKAPQRERSHYPYPEVTTKRRGRMARIGGAVLSAVTSRAQQTKNWFYQADYYGEKRLNQKKVTIAAVSGLALAAVGVYAANKFGLNLDDIFGRHRPAPRPKQQSSMPHDLVPRRPSASNIGDVFSHFGKKTNSLQDVGDHVRAVVPQRPLPDTSVVEQFSVTDMPWDVLSRKGVQSDQIMERLDGAARQLHTQQGIPFEWHGNGSARWLEVNGQSDTQSVMTYLSPYLG